MIANPVVQGEGGITWIPIPSAQADTPITRAPPTGTTYSFSVTTKLEKFFIIVRTTPGSEFIVYVNSDDGLKSISTSGATLYDSGSTFVESTFTANISFTASDFITVTNPEYSIIYP